MLRLPQMDMRERFSRESECTTSYFATRVTEPSGAKRAARLIVQSGNEFFFINDDRYSKVSKQRLQPRVEPTIPEGTGR